MVYDKPRKNRDLILASAEQNKIRTVKVFGSVVRGEERSDSDLDLLVEFKEGGNLFDLIRFKQSVADLLHVKVDVITEESVHRLISEEILNETVKV